MTGQPRHRALGGVDVALHLGERDRRVGRAAVGVADRVARVLPALVEQAKPRAAAVLDEPVAVEVAVAVDPVERRQRVRPQALEQLVVAGPGVDLAEDDEPQRRRIDRAVVGVVRGLPGSGHLAGPQLVEDLARLGVVPRVVGRGLQAGEDGQRVGGDARIERDQLERGDEAVATEQGGEPGNAGGQVRLALGRPVVAQHRQVGQRAAQRAVEDLVVRVDPRRLEQLVLERRRDRRAGRDRGARAGAGDPCVGRRGRGRRAPASRGPVRPARGRRAIDTVQPKLARSLDASRTRQQASTLAPGQASGSATGSSVASSKATVVVRTMPSRPS